MRSVQSRPGLACIVGMALILGAACASPIKTAHDFDPEANFARYKSYAWIEDGPLIGPSYGVKQPPIIHAGMPLAFNVRVQRTFSVQSGSGEPVVMVNTTYQDCVSCRR